MFDIIIVSIISGLSLIGVYNFFTAPRLRKRKPKAYPLVSILIPARNEERNIANCIESALQQSYPHFEVLIYDDLSEDNTAQIVKEYEKKSDKVTLIHGKPLPAGWLGKPWGCHNLSKHAKGDLYLFIDADVTIEPETISSAVALFQQKNVNMLSCFPKQQMQSRGELLLVPVMDWMVLTFIPLYLVYTTKKLSIAIGQFILIDKPTYKKINGHEGVKSFKTEDTALARNVKKIGAKLLAARSTGLVRCRMYGNFLDSFRGLSRSFYEGSHMKPVAYVLGLVGLLVILFFPLITSLVAMQYYFMLIPWIIQRILTSITAGQNAIINVLLLPIHSMFAIVIGIYSIYISLNKKIVWKGRKLNKKK